VDAKYGIELFRSGNTEGAIKALRDATGKDKTNADVWYYLGLALVKHHEPKDARKAFETTIRLRPNFAAARNGLAYTLIMAGKNKDARRVAEESLKLEPANAETHYLLGVLQLRSNAYGRSLEEADASLKIASDYAPALYLKVESLLGLSGGVLSASVGETPKARDAMLEKNRARIDEATATLEKYAGLNPRGEEAESVRELREQIDVMRIYSGLGGKMPAAGGETYTAKDLTTRAVVKDRPEPLYTQRARANQVTGTVRLRMVLAADGTVKYIFALTRLPDGLTESAIRAARSIKFIPATKDGHPVSQFVTIDYNFNIY
jgi:TonB family protein